jgi:hypothetical protein
MFMPWTAAFLGLHPEIEIVRPRVHYGHLYPNDPLMWKVACFRDWVLPEASTLYQLMSIGDSLAERVALLQVTSEWNAQRPAGEPPIRAKTIKLSENPSVPVMTQELELLLTWIAHLVFDDEDLDLEIVRLPDNEMVLQECAPVDVGSEVSFVQQAPPPPLSPPPSTPPPRNKIFLVARTSLARVVLVHVHHFANPPNSRGPSRLGLCATRWRPLCLDRLGQLLLRSCRRWSREAMCLCSSRRLRIQWTCRLCPCQLFVRSRRRLRQKALRLYPTLSPRFQANWIWFVPSTVRASTTLR